MTASDFFTRLGAAGLAGSGANVEGRYRFDIDGPGGGSWVLDFDRSTVTAGPGAAQALVHAAERDFVALVEGRISLTDALLTERLHTTGEVGGLVRVAERLQQALKTTQEQK